MRYLILGNLHLLGMAILALPSSAPHRLSRVGLEFRVEGLEFRGLGLGFRVQGLGFSGLGPGFRVQGVVPRLNPAMKWSWVEPSSCRGTHPQPPRAKPFTGFVPRAPSHRGTATACCGWVGHPRGALVGGQNRSRDRGRKRDSWAIRNIEASWRRPTTKIRTIPQRPAAGDPCGAASSAGPNVDRRLC